MAKRIDYQAMVGLVIKNKDYGDVQVIEYLGKVKNDNLYEVLFLRSKNKEIVKYKALIGKMKLIDHIQKKVKRRMKNQEELVQRNRLTKKGWVNPVPKDLDITTVLALDAATKVTGWRPLFKSGVGTGDSGVIEPISSWELDKRCKFIANEIRDTVMKFGAKEIVIEDIYLGLNSNIQVMLAELRGYIRGATRIRVHKININAWKSFYVEMPKGRDAQKEFAIEKFTELFGYVPRTDDEADSGLIGYYAVNKYKMAKAPFEF